MKRIDFFIDENSFEYLKSLPGTVSEHIRWAIGEYVHKRRQEEVRLTRNSSLSASTTIKIGGESNE